jgi:hypothetical protein
VRKCYWSRSSGRTILLLLLAGCGPRDTARVAAGTADLLVTIQARTITAPDSIEPGWRRVRVLEDGAGHIVVIFRLPEAGPDDGVAAFLAALDTARATPQPAVALGGPEVGDSGEVVVHLTPGRYLLGCVRRGSGRHRHASTGEATVVTVTGSTRDHESPPAATQELGMVEFAYVGPERWPAGVHLLRLDNKGKQDHQLRLSLLEPGATLQDWFDSDGDVGTAVSGVARMGPGAVAFLPVELAAGTYVAYCLIPDPVSGRAHVEMGMARAILVE